LQLEVNKLKYEIRVPFAKKKIPNPKIHLLFCVPFFAKPIPNSEFFSHFFRFFLQFVVGFSGKNENFIGKKRKKENFLSAENQQYTTCKTLI